MKPINDTTRQRIINLLNENKSARQVAKIIGVSHTAVNKIGRQELPDLEKGKKGRPKKINERMSRMMMRQITTGQVDTAAQLKKSLENDYGLILHASSVQRELKNMGLKSSSKIKKPKISLDNKKDRVKFALKYQHWTVDDWKLVIWSDETKINRIGSDGRKWVWRRPGEPLSERVTQPTLKFGGGSLMFWGCMTARGVGYGTRIFGTMDAKIYTSILEDELQDTMEFYHQDPGDFYFQHDNDTKHTSLLATNWLAEHGYQVLDWPSQSPDLNPIEHLWDHLKRELAKQETPPDGIEELWKLVQVEWEKIPQETCITLIESMPRRIEAVLKANGGVTKY